MLILLLQFYPKNEIQASNFSEQIALYYSKFTTITSLSSEHLNKLRWILIKDRVVRLKVNLMYRVLDGVASSYLSDHVHPIPKRHSDSTHSSQNEIVIPHYGIISSTNT